MNRFLIIVGVLLLFSKQLWCQQDSILKLDEVVVSDSKLHSFSDGFKLQTLNDSLIQRNTSSLTELLVYNTFIYFRENGYGMVSSPSFRGTNASQTAVIWNGIAINSNLTGQTDFNTVTVNSFDNVHVRSGGGSVQYGSGAVGGSIHLDNTISFKEENNHRMRLLYGDFNTLSVNAKSILSSDKIYTDIGVDYISSDNNYKYLGTGQENQNGEFKTFNLSTNAGFKINSNNVIRFHSNFFHGDRSFSGTLTAPSNDNYRDFTARNLLSWQKYTKRYVFNLKVAHLFEKYKYFPNKDRDEFSEGRTHSFISDFNFDYHFNSKIKSSFIVNYTHIDAKGSNIGNNGRKTLATTLLLNHKLTSKVSYGMNIRKEFLNNFKIPILFSLDGKYKSTQWHTISFNASKNYRVPTFNDLFWNAGGNIDLQPETSIQGEIGNGFSFKNLNILISAFYIDSEDLIQWRPNNLGVWSPINIQAVQNYGFEVSSTYKKAFGKHKLFFNTNYAYTSAQNKENKNQLIYVPFHKFTGLFNYGYRKTDAYIQFLYNGQVYTTTDNTDTVDAYGIFNLGFNYNLNNKQKPYLVGFKVNNLFNKYYENVAFRPMPNRHIQFYLNFNF